MPHNPFDAALVPPPTPPRPNRQSVTDHGGSSDRAPVVLVLSSPRLSSLLYLPSLTISYYFSLSLAISCYLILSLTHLSLTSHPGVRFEAPPGPSGEEGEALKDIAVRVELKAVEASMFMVISPANEKFVSEYVIENRYDCVNTRSRGNVTYIKDR